MIPSPHWSYLVGISTIPKLACSSQPRHGHKRLTIKRSPSYNPVQQSFELEKLHKANSANVRSPSLCSSLLTASPTHEFSIHCLHNTTVHLYSFQPYQTTLKWDSRTVARFLHYVKRARWELHRARVYSSRNQNTSANNRPLRLPATSDSNSHSAMHICSCFSISSKYENGQTIKCFIMCYMPR